MFAVPWVWSAIINIQYLIQSSKPQSLASAVAGVVYPRHDVTCITNMPIGFVSLSGNYERRAILAYRLRKCRAVIYQDAYNGSDLQHLLEFLPVGILERGLANMKQGAPAPAPEDWKIFDYLEAPRQAPAAQGSRTQMKEIVAHFTPHERKRYLDALQAAVRWWQKGRPGELALFTSTHLLLWKLQKISDALPAVRRPCVLTLEDDAIPHLVYFHSKTLKQFCGSGKESIDAWQLMWHKGDSRAYDRMPRQYRKDYDIDGAVSREYWCTAGMLWRTDNIDGQLIDLQFREQGLFHPYLDCQHYDCLADHFYPETTVVRVPVVPWIGIPISDHSTGLHVDSEEVKRIGVRAIGAGAQFFEYQSFGASVVLSGDLNSTLTYSPKLELSRALQRFQEDPEAALGSTIYKGSILGRIIIDIPKHLREKSNKPLASFATGDATATPHSSTKEAYTSSKSSLTGYATTTSYSSIIKGYTSSGLSSPISGATIATVSVASNMYSLIPRNTESPVAHS
eukprot:Gregarina_sp_Poly_1__2176@NODE_1579_length_3800_cov_211_833914_g208_i2_p2_GENE_NODE_1579_length_3800_cov_211_833914_g208_i2NODE_1579_length_3800_cov_211_833914_g208_i2_p2_ORF_typecomplete_len510_score29_86DUF3440/PF11922_8/0_076DUF3440/PF11922_8/1_1e04_NODE_1579_length_3800_cov_211_833914_g208_i26832212